MKGDFSYFYKYVRIFGEKEGSIPSLKGPNGLVSDGRTKAQILNKQYSSVWSVPVVKLNDNGICNLFEDCTDCKL